MIEVSSRHPCIALINERLFRSGNNFDREVSQGSEVYISSIVVYELWYGVSKSQRRDMNAHLLVGFLMGPVQQLAFDDEDARFAGELRAELEMVGRPIGDYDLLIVLYALRHKMIGGRTRSSRGQDVPVGRLVEGLSGTLAVRRLIAFWATPHDSQDFHKAFIT